MGGGGLRNFRVERFRERLNFFGRGWQLFGGPVDWRQCGNRVALCYFAVVMEMPDSLLMNCKSEFGVIFLRCSPT